MTWLALALVLTGCSQTDSRIVPLEEPTHDIMSIALPTPQIQNAPNGYYQDDDGLRVAIAAVNIRAIPLSNQDERGTHYLILTLTLTNLSDDSRDVTSFPFTISVRDSSSNQEYAPELAAPSDNNLWRVIDQLDKDTVKTLDDHETLRGELSFQVPTSATEFELIWQPTAQRQWILSIPKLR